MAKEKSAIERFAESKFMRKLQEGSQKLASNEIFSTISGGMGASCWASGWAWCAVRRWP